MVVVNKFATRREIKQRARVRKDSISLKTVNHVKKFILVILLTVDVSRSVKEKETLPDVLARMVLRWKRMVKAARRFIHAIKMRWKYAIKYATRNRTSTNAHAKLTSNWPMIRRLVSKVSPVTPLANLIRSYVTENTLVF